MEIRGDHVTLRPVVRKDAPGLAKILATPEVARWWPAYDLARVEAEFLVSEPDYVVYAIDVDGRLVGLLQTHEEPEPEFRHASIDLFLDPAVHGQGLGPDAIRAVIGHLIAADGHHRLTIDPAADNERAIRAYEKVGFRPVGRLRQYQRFPDGTWQDGLLMELLAEEFRGRTPRSLAHEAWLMAFERLDYIYMPSRDVAADMTWFRDVLGGRVVFAIDALGTRVAMIELTTEPPRLLLADHVEGDVPILVYRVASLADTTADLESRGWTRGHTLEIPQGPVCSFRAPGGQRLAVYELVRPGVEPSFEGRRDFG